jgi:hypothetical protein
MKTTKLYWFIFSLLIILIGFSFTSCSPDNDPYQDCMEYNAWVDQEIAKLRSFDKWNLATQKEIKRLLSLKQECN